MHSKLFVLVMAISGAAIGTACGDGNDDVDNNSNDNGDDDNGGECANPEKLVTLDDAVSIQDIVLDGTHVYFVTGTGTSGTVQKVPLAGGAATQLVARGGMSIVSDDSNVYWIDATNVWRVAKSGGAEQKVAPNALGSPQGRSLGVDATHLYFNHGNDLVRVPKTATNTTTYETVADVTVNSLVLAGDTIYFTTDHTVGKVAKTGGAVVTLAEGMDDLNDIAVCGSSVFIIDYSDTTKRLLKLGTSAGGAPVELTTFSGSPTVGLACDSEHVYFSPQFATLLKRIPLAGGAVEEFSCDGGYHPALSATDVYWIDYETSVLDKQAK